MRWSGILLFTTFVVTFSFFALDAKAASLYIDPISVDVLKADTVVIGVRVDTDEGECINTVDASIAFDDTIQAVDVSRGKSILTLWVEDPVIDNDENTIRFAGGIPNGYCGRVSGDPGLTNVVAEIVFRAPGFTVGGDNKDVNANISFLPETRVLLNDGNGTEASLRTIGGNVNLLQRIGTTTSDSWNARIINDDTPPQPFSIELVQDDTIFNGRYYIVFNTTDKQSGIDHYEVIEEAHADLGLFKWGGVDAPWAEVKSPYVLKDQTLNSIIRVKALDKSGNEWIAVFVPNEALRSQAQLPLIIVGVLAIVVLAGVLLVGGFYFFKRRKREPVDLTVTESEHDTE